MTRATWPSSVNWNQVGAALTASERVTASIAAEDFRAMVTRLSSRGQAELADSLGELADICDQLAAPIVVVSL